MATGGLARWRGGLAGGLLLCVALAVPVRGDGLADAIRRHLETQTQATALNEAVADFYRLRDNRPAWNDPARVRALTAALESLADDGLTPSDYDVAALAQGSPPESEDDAAAFDLRATRACLLALAHLYWGKVDPRSLDPKWSFEPRGLNRADALARISADIDADRIAPMFDAARPANSIYARLRAVLAQYRRWQASGGWPQIPPGPALKPGASDPRVAVLRRRLAAVGAVPAEAVDAEVYDPALVAAVKDYQRAQYLPATGIVDAATRASLNVPIEQRIDQLRVNLERARWLLDWLKGEFVLVDIAGYRIIYYRDGQPLWRSRVQVGRPYRRTPLFHSEIREVEFNPTWTVPPTILKNDILPKVRRNTSYLTRNHIRVFDAQGREVDPAAVNWHRPAGLTLRQDAGPDNALGRVALRFPNPYNVYLHDTPHQELFDAARRNFSSGCIRVERVMELVELLFADPAHWNREAIDRILATQKTQVVKLPHPVPLIVQYWTVNLLPDGGVAFKPDVYGRDPPLLAALDRPTDARE